MSNKEKLRFKLYNLEEARLYLNDLQVVCTDDSKDVEILEEEKEENVTMPEVDKKLQLGSCSCGYCDISFPNVTEQRAHFKLDWHRYNIKQYISGLPSVNEEAFDSLADDVSSISGSESESDSDDSESEKETKLTAPENIQFSRQHAKIICRNKDNKLLTMYRCLISSKRCSSLINNKSVEVFSCKPVNWMIIMIGGGHFAAAVFADSQPVVHKTFHSYTVRAKQGGTQSSRDGKGNHPKSAGASLRRYNEQSLAQHVQHIVSAWSKEISVCDLIFYRAAGPGNRKILFGGKTPTLDKNDERIRSIPFPTRRATFNEVKRVFDMLATVHVYGSVDELNEEKQLTLERREIFKSRDNSKTSPKKHDRGKERKEIDRNIPELKLDPSSTDESCSEMIIQENDTEISFSMLKEHEDSVPQWIKDARKENSKKKKKKNVKKKREQDEKDKLEKEKSELKKKLVTCCRTNDVDMLVDCLKKTRVDHVELMSNQEETQSALKEEDLIDCLNTPVNDDSKDTILHVAASKCLPQFVTILLTRGADPGVKNKKNLPPYSVSGDKDTKSAFKLFAKDYPEKYNYKQAQIPEPLTEEQELELQERKKEKRKQKKEKEKVAKKVNALKKVENEEKERFLSLSDREKCALAAEKRLVTSQTSNIKSAVAPVLSRCFQCGLNITGKVPFEYDFHRFCTVKCLQTHRAKTNSYGKEI